MKTLRLVRECRLAAGALLAIVALVAVGCTADYVTGSDAPVNMYITSLNGGAKYNSDVRLGADSSVVCEDEVPIEVTLQKKNPNAPVGPGDQVLLTSYEVRFFRTDGRGVEGVDVPYRITGNLRAPLEAKTTVSIEVVRRQAKLEPPLSTIYQTAVLTVMAEITVYGETTAGKRVSATGRMQIDFADLLDSKTQCGK